VLDAGVVLDCCAQSSPIGPPLRGVEVRSCCLVSPGATPLKWLVDQGNPVIPKTLNPKHMAEDMNLFSWELSKDAKSKLDAATSPASVETVAADCKITVVV